MRVENMLIVGVNPARLRRFPSRPFFSHTDSMPKIYAGLYPTQFTKEEMTACLIIQVFVNSLVSRASDARSYLYYTTLSALYASWRNEKCFMKDMKFVLQ